MPDATALCYREPGVLHGCIWRRERRSWWQTMRARLDDTHNWTPTFPSQDREWNNIRYQKKTFGRSSILSCVKTVDQIHTRAWECWKGSQRSRLNALKRWNRPRFAWQGGLSERQELSPFAIMPPINLTLDMTSDVASTNSPLYTYVVVENGMEILKGYLPSFSHYGIRSIVESLRIALMSYLAVVFNTLLLC